MVSNYIDNKCKYDLNRLVNVVYLISEDAVKDIRIDNGDAYIASISQSPIEIKCYGIKLTEDESFDERYKFTHKLTFSVDGYSNHNDLQDRYYVIVKDEDGTYWMLNPLFPCKVTYTYNLGYNEDHTDFTLATVSNHPMLEVKNFTVADAYECKAYWIGGIDKLWLNEKKYSKHIGNKVKYTNEGGFKQVDFRLKSGLLTESYDGEKISHSINFNIGFDDYKTSWHYNLLEFIDNIYASVIKTKNEKYTLCGFGYGMQPSFTINADDTKTTNNISVSLTDAHNVGDTLEFYDDIEYEYLSGRTWVYTKEHNGYECVGDGIARYLLMKEIDAFENETGNFKCLEGYEHLFTDLNIVGTFSETEIFYSQECNGFGECLVYTSLDNMIFNDVSCRYYSLRCDGDWSITSSNTGITVSPSSGVANTNYSLTVCNEIEPTSASVDVTLTLNYCFNKNENYNVKVREYNGCLTKGERYYISAEATTLTIPSKCCITKVRETTSIGVTLVVYSDRFIVTVPMNNSGNIRNINLLVEYCDGSSQTCVIVQDDILRRWVNTGETICLGNDEYQPQLLYTGTTLETLVPTDETRNVFVGAGTQKCEGALYRWVETGEEGCDGCLVGEGMNAVSTFEGSYQYQNVHASMSTTAASTCNGIFNDYLRACPRDSEEKVIYASDMAKYTDICLSDNIEYLEVRGNNKKVNPIIVPPSVTGLSCDPYPDGMEWAMDQDIEGIIGGDNVKAIGKYAFLSNPYIKWIVLGENLERISYLAFNYCSNLKNVIIKATTPPIITNPYTEDSRPIENFPSDMKIFVPRESLGLYKTAKGWRTYPDNMIQAFN